MKDVEYSLAKTKRLIAEWMSNADPNPPSDLIELLGSAAYWLERQEKIDRNRRKPRGRRTP